MSHFDKKSFASRVPFEQHKNYLVWLKISSILLLGLVLGLFYWSFHSYQKYQYLLITKKNLFAEVSQFDEIVRKKNKLLALDSGQTKHGKKSHGIHAKIVDYLKQIEKSLTAGVQLNSFEYIAKKIEITGYSRDIAIENLDKLDFVNTHELEQISNGTKESGGKLAFTIALNL